MAAPPSLRPPGERALDQITVEWNRRRRSIDRVNLIYPYGVERIHVIGRNRAAVPYNHDPLYRVTSSRLARDSGSGPSAVTRLVHPTVIAPPPPELHSTIRSDEQRVGKEG